MNRYELFDRILNIRGKDPYARSANNLLLSQWYLSAIRTFESGENSKAISLLERVKSVYEYRIVYGLNKWRCTLRSENLRKADIYFWPVEVTHVNQQLNLWKRLRETNGSFQIVTNKTNIFQRIRNEGFKAHFISEDFYPTRKYPTPVDLASFTGKLGAVNAKDPATDKLLQVFDTVYEGYKSSMMRFLSFAARLAETNPKTRLVVGYDITLEGRSAAFMARAEGIRTFTIMHGSVAGEPMDAEHVVDCHFVYGDVAKEHLISIGHDPRTLVVAGAPYLDNMNIENADRNAVLVSKLGLKNELPYFLVALSGPGHCTSFEHFERVVRKVMELSRTLEYQFVSKLHRKDSAANYTPVAAQTPGNKLPVIENGTKGYPTAIFEWLKGCTAILTGSSTVALEAMLMNIPVITIDFMNEHQGVDFIEFGATIHVTNEAELENALITLVDSPEAFKETRERAAEYISRFFYKIDKRTSERLIDTIRA